VILKLSIFILLYNYISTHKEQDKTKKITFFIYRNKAKVKLQYYQIMYLTIETKIGLPEILFKINITVYQDRQGLLETCLNNH
jgi:hypothetical protein